MNANTRKARLIAFYLPQFHPIPENDEWWGKGFTEWLMVTRAKPLFPGHYQPRIPTDLGYYDLRFPEVRLAQAEMAKQYGLEGFCYWHYWFAGRRLLEIPFNETLRSGEPNFPFCLAWANHSWYNKWGSFGGRMGGLRGLSPRLSRLLIEQTYPGLEDHERHFYYLLEAFTDSRYITVEGKPLFYIYDPYKIPDAKRVTDYWRELAYKAGLKGLHLVGRRMHAQDVEKLGFDASDNMFLYGAHRLLSQKHLFRALTYRRSVRLLIRRPFIYTYEEAIPLLLKDRALTHEYPTIIPNFDNTPRASYYGIVFHESTPELFRRHLTEALEMVVPRPMERRIIFVSSWNEWGEGNYLEPDQHYGRGYLEVIRDEIFTNSNQGVGVRDATSKS